METLKINGLVLFFDASEQDAAKLIGAACEKSVQIIHERWGLDIPEDCRVYVMTSWLRFLFHAPPWPYRILVAATLPLWYFRARKLWALAGGWHQPSASNPRAFYSSPIRASGRVSLFRKMTCARRFGATHATN